jgi:hypothetical protein
MRPDYPFFDHAYADLLTRTLAVCLYVHDNESGLNHECSAAVRTPTDVTNI